jgi:hypothetical protein
MPARCHEDSCSIKWSEVSTLSGPAYQADVNTDGDATPSATPTITCGTDGLQVIVSPQAGNLLSSIPDGLFAGLPIVQHGSFVGAQVDLPNGSDADSSNSLAGYSIANSSTEDRMLVITGSFELVYKVLIDSGVVARTATRMEVGGVPVESSNTIVAGPGNPILELFPFNANIRYELTVGPGLTDLIQYSSLSGVVGVPVGNDFEQKRDYRGFALLHEIPAGSTFNLSAIVGQSGVGQNINVLANEGPTYGFRALLDWAMIPMPSA